MVACTIVGLAAYSALRPKYQNDDYQPPAAGQGPALTTVSASEVPAIYDNNQLYAQRVATPTRCELPAGFDLPSATDAQTKAYLGDLMVCNLRVWDPAFRATGKYQQVRPVVNVYGTKVSTPCGTSGINAFYCATNQQVYYSRSLPDQAPSMRIVNDPHVLDYVISHEYGHAVQGRTGILLGTMHQENEEDKAAALELNRLLELQADCFGGLVMASVAQSAGFDDQIWRNLTQGAHAVGDDVLTGKPNIVGNHGHAKNREYWFQVGATANGDVGRCNTYKAPSSQVE